MQSPCLEAGAGVQRTAGRRAGPIVRGGSSRRHSGPAATTVCDPFGMLAISSQVASMHAQHSSFQAGPPIAAGGQQWAGTPAAWHLQRSWHCCTRCCAGRQAACFLHSTLHACWRWTPPLHPPWPRKQAVWPHQVCACHERVQSLPAGVASASPHT
jgi:hypothetical protein